MGMGQQVGPWALFHDASSLQHDYPVAEAAGHAQVVGDEDHAQAQLPLQLAQQPQDFGLHFSIEHADAFITEQHPGFEDQGAGNGHPLLLAPRELAGQAPLEVLRGSQSHRSQLATGLLPCLGGTGQAVDEQRIGDGFAHRHLGIEAGQGILEHHLQAAARPGQFGSPQLAQVLALQAHLAAPHRHQAHQGAAEAALAAAGSPHHPQGFPLVELEADAIHGLQPPLAPGGGGQGMPAAQLLHLQQQRRGRCGLAVPPLALAGRPHQAAPHIRHRRGQELVAGTLLHQAAISKDGDPLAPTAGHGQVMADQQQGAARFGTEVAQLSHHLGGDGHIQAGGGFIGDHQGRVEGQGQGDRQPLAHATAELVRIAAIAGGIDADPFQQALGPFEAALAAVGLQGVPEVFAHGHQRIEPGHRVLKHQPRRLPPQLLQGAGAETTGILAGELEPAFAEAARGQ